MALTAKERGKKGQDIKRAKEHAGKTGQTVYLKDWRQAVEPDGTVRDWTDEEIQALAEEGEPETAAQIEAVEDLEESGAVRGDDGHVGPDPRVISYVGLGFDERDAVAIVALIDAGRSAKEAVALISNVGGEKLHTGKPDWTKEQPPEAAEPVVSKDPRKDLEAGKDFEVAEVVVRIRKKHIAWLLDIEEAHGILMEESIKRCLNHAYAQDSGRHDRRRAMQGEQSFTGRREDFQQWQGQKE